MQMEGDAPEGQPAEGVMTLDSLAAQLDAPSEVAPVESEGSEADDEAEGIEPEADDSADEPQEDEEPAEEPTFTIKVDGKEVTLKQSEILEQAQKGFDYTQKTMAVAEERKAVESERAKAQELRARNEQLSSESVNRLQAIASFMEAELGSPPPIELAQSDAYTYLAQKELYESRKGKLEDAQRALYQLQQEQARERQAWIQQKAEEAEAALKNTLPDWNDAKLQELSAYVGDLGLTPQTADMALLNPGFWQLAHKAKAYDALMKQKATLKPVQQMPKVIKPSGNAQPPQLAKRQEAFKRHKANPSLQSLADLL